jgi:hypothetical protein
MITRRGESLMTAGRRYARYPALLPLRHLSRTWQNQRVAASPSFRVTSSTARLCRMQLRRLVGGELVVAAAQILHEHVPGGQDLGEPVQELVEASGGEVGGVVAVAVVVLADPAAARPGLCASAGLVTGPGFSGSG